MGFQKRFQTAFVLFAAAGRLFFAPHQIVAQRRHGRVEAVGADTGDVFVVVFFNMQGVGVETRLLHHGLRQRLFLHYVEIEAAEDFGQEGGFGGAERRAMRFDDADVVGIADFVAEQLLHGGAFCVCLCRFRRPGGC